LLNFKSSIPNTSTKLIPTATRDISYNHSLNAAPALNLREHQIPLVGRMSQTISIEARMHAVLDAYAHFFRRVPSFTMAHAGLNDRGDCAFGDSIIGNQNFPRAALFIFPHKLASARAF
jgi:hypothetical protein